MWTPSSRSSSLSKSVGGTVSLINVGVVGKDESEEKYLWESIKKGAKELGLGRTRGDYSSLRSHWHTVK
jgi:hypothetical protein